MTGFAGAGVLDGMAAEQVGGVGCGRRERTDITVRDTLALRWVGEQYGVRLDVVGVLLGRLGGAGGPLSLRTVRDVVARWERRGMAVAERSATGVWVSLTKRGLDRVGLGVREYRVPWNLERHHHAVSCVRLAYEGIERPGAWVSERLTWSERAGAEASWHVPDGVVRTDDWQNGGWSEAVEVELTRKPLVEYRDDVFGNLRHGSHPIRMVRYFVADERFRERLAEDLGVAVRENSEWVNWSVELLPVVEGTSYIEAVRRG